MLLALATASAAQGIYPSRQITIVVGFSAGGSTDIVARLVAEEMRKTWGQPVVIDNKPGAKLTEEVKTRLTNFKKVTEDARTSVCSDFCGGGAKKGLDVCAMRVEVIGDAAIVVDSGTVRAVLDELQQALTSITYEAKTWNEDAMGPKPPFRTPRRWLRTTTAGRITARTTRSCEATR